jgi:acetyl esterase/lipase
MVESTGWRSRGERTRMLPLWDDPGDGRQLELLLPSSVNRDDPPVTVVNLAGGGYRYRSWHEGPAMALWLAMHGFAAVDVPYTTAEDTGGDPVGPRALRDACRAVRVVRDHVGQDGLSPERVVVLGYSAGGHLAGSTALLHADTDAHDPLGDTWSGRPDAVAMVYPVVSMVPPCHEGSVRHLLGAGAGGAARERASLQKRVTADAPPMFTVFAQDDGSVPIRGAMELAAAYEAAGCSFEAHFFPRGGHGFGLGLERDGGVSAWPGLLVSWLRSFAR